jgi:hypothetical protein
MNLRFAHHRCELAIAAHYFASSAEWSGPSSCHKVSFTNKYSQQFDLGEEMAARDQRLVLI